MSKRPMTYGQAMMTDILVGAVAGVVAAAAMHAFQRGWAAFIDEPKGTPSTEKAADAIAEAISGNTISPGRKSLAGNAVHYTTGAIIGAAYGLLAGLVPIVTIGRGTLFGTTLFGLGDELAVPAIGFRARASEIPPEEHAYSAASHAVFALTLDTIRRKINEHISAD